MVAFFCPPPFAASKRDLSPLSFQASGSAASTTSSQRVHNHTIAVGAASTTRWVVVFCLGNTTNDAVSVTIGGVAATIVRKAGNIASQGPLVMAFANVPTGTSLTVAVDYGASITSSFVVFSVFTGSQNIAVTSSEYVTAAANSPQARSIPLNVSKGGAMFSIAYGTSANMTTNTSLALTNFSFSPFGFSARAAYGIGEETVSGTLSNASCAAIGSLSIEPA